MMRHRRKKLNLFENVKSLYHAKLQRGLMLAGLPARRRRASLREDDLKKILRKELYAISYSYN